MRENTILFAAGETRSVIVLTLSLNLTNVDAVVLLTMSDA